MTLSTRPLDGRVAIITGAARGLGYVIAETFARNGAKVVLLDVDGPEVQAAAGRISNDGATALAVMLDLCDSIELRRTVDRINRELGSIDVLVNNAGIIDHCAFEDVTMSDWDRVMAINVRAVFELSQAVGTRMAAQGGGVIVNIGSIAGHFGYPTGAAYAVSKAAVRALTEQLALAWGRDDVRCNTVSPGLGSWFMSGVDEDPAVKEREASRVPLGRTGRPEDFAAVVLFLASDGGRYVNGQTILVDGGLSSSLLTQLSRDP